MKPRESVSHPCLASVWSYRARLAMVTFLSYPWLGLRLILLPLPYVYIEALGPHSFSYLTVRPDRSRFRLSCYAPLPTKHREFLDSRNNHQSASLNLIIIFRSISHPVPKWSFIQRPTRLQRALHLERMWSSQSLQLKTLALYQVLNKEIQSEYQSL